jgi:hypothetical protein
VTPPTHHTPDDLEDRLGALLAGAVDRLEEVARSAGPPRRRPRTGRALAAAAAVVVVAGLGVGAVASAGDDEPRADDIRVADDTTTTVPSTTTTPTTPTTPTPTSAVVVGTSPTGDDVLAVGDDEGFLALDPDAPTEIWSSDDGASWTATPIEIPGVEDLTGPGGGGGLGALELDDGILVATPSGWDDQLVPRVWVSSDRGRSWAAQALEVDLGPVAPLRERTVRVADVELAAGRILVAATAVDSFSPIALIEEVTGVAPTGTFATQLAGDQLLIWLGDDSEQLRIPLADHGLVPDDLVASTTRTVLWRSDDGGGTWSAVVAPDDVASRTTSLGEWRGGWVISGIDESARHWGDLGVPTDPVVATSQDGVTWTPVEGFPQDGDWALYVQAGGLADDLAVWTRRWYAPTRAAALAVTSDGTAWTVDVVLEQALVPPVVPEETPPDQLAAAMSYDEPWVSLGGTRSDPAVVTGTAGMAVAFIEQHVDFTGDPSGAPRQTPEIRRTRGWVEWTRDGATWERVDLPPGEGARALVVTDDQILVLAAPFPEPPGG